MPGFTTLERKVATKPGEGHLDWVRGCLLILGCARNLAETRIAWLARPGMATLLEAREGAIVAGRLSSSL